MHTYPPDTTRRQLIFTADDFGLSKSVNEAIQMAHQDGILTCASLMVAAEGAEDAIRRARATPTLAIGLHLVLSNGAPQSGPDEIPDLVDEDGQFSDQMVAAGFHYFLSRRARQQIEHEIRAQFKAFEATGFILDHVNVHKHFHFHPTLLSLIIRVGEDYGMRALRLPIEPLALVLAMGQHVPVRSRLQPALLWPLSRWMCSQMDRAHLGHNDYIVGLSASGQMTADLVLSLLPHLPAGIGEIYFHPAREPDPGSRPLTTHGPYNIDLQSLLDRRIPAALERLGIRRTTFHDAV